jgi:hypothetical protein
MLNGGVAWQEWRTMPERVFGSTLAWLRLRARDTNDTASCTAAPEPEAAKVRY